MTGRRPPALATWLFEWMVSDPRREALAGDLVERYGAGGSAGWYWRQVLVAIVSSFLRDFGDHKLLAVRAVAVGWALYWMSSFPVRWLWSLGYPPRILTYVACGITGWMVARFHRAHRVSAIAMYAGSLLLVHGSFLAWDLIVNRHPVTTYELLLLNPLILIAEPLSILIGGLSIAPPESARRAE
jgi:hypothetical protein